MLNEYKIEGDITIVYINRPSENKILECLIDTDDLDLIKGYDGAWTAIKNSGNYYVRNYYGQYLHRIVMNAPKGTIVDHVHHNTLDNRKSQLRITCRKNNARNRNGSTVKSESGIRGVGWDKKSNKWRAVIWLNGKNKHLGFYENKYEAGRVATEARLRYFGSTFVDRKPIIIE